ncbi:DMT family transporter [Mesorhizobium microcysteis]|jgi:drug/metabolite transporter (DMT)-like permease|uniref:DMT family transporter n=1 Tax=Neoaquamicrobium microcysteis TaxID=2682781 RepID=A0A5D4GNG8_9HYPH|nr:DMT family transporter [Mesorhizobium microcysteis]TYR29664.1 DMT family transporter [Mesorhizobium microcysteis]
MELWIPITIAAAFLQNLRSAAQKHLKAVMGTTGATFVRFGFGLPFALFFLATLHLVAGYRIPAPNAAFLFWVGVGAFGQIGATFLLIHLFSHRNFAVGTAYSRTEPAQTALFALIFFGERVTGGTLAAIAISVFGVMLISVAHMHMSWRNLVASIFARNALIGLASGTLFGIAAVAYRAASLALGGPNFMMQAAVTLVWTISLQTLVMAGWMVWKDRAEIGRIAKAWKVALFTGFVGATASFGWFMAMTLQQAAVVKALAQVEMLFTFAASVFFFKEKINRIETAGCLLIVAGILILLVA